MIIRNLSAALVAGLIWANLGLQPAQAAEVVVTIDNFTFTPQTVTVHPGDKIVWQNHDDIPHSVVAPGTFKSPALDTDENFSFNFDKVGTVDYFCGLHPHMQGKIVVAP
ncbi:MAG: putative copper binding protein [Frankiales bacterium]|nr:putative copper binding protein [Frankiales bacterium]